MTEAELAARWRHSLRTLQRWRAAGYGPPHVRIGNRVVFRVSDVEAFEANREADE
ncbi:MAG: helix-turn-helix domain-containing protein [Bauldia sp.]|nr:helix-turn-helix domain-containing protein [Bauldia sp.]MCC0067723.1 helix-turn-helix domain-containing protein [Rhodovulum sp.]